MLTCSESCVITSSTGKGAFATTDAKLYIPVVALPTQDNIKLPQQLKLEFKRTIKLNKYQSKYQRRYKTSI